MTHWSFEIQPSPGRDIWPIICGLACLVLISYALFARLWQKLLGWLALVLIAIGIIGTLCIAAIPVLQTRPVGLVWMFILLCLLSATFYLNLHPQLGTLKTAALLTIRLLAIAMLVPMFFEPRIRFVTKPKPERPLLIVVDDSGSMSFQDVPNGPTRLQSAWQLLRPQLPRIDEHFIPQYFTFATDAQKLSKPDDLAKLSPDGNGTDLAKSITKAFTLAQPLRSDAEMIIITDGRDNASANVLDAIGSSRRKIHTVRVGSEQAEPTSFPNVAVDNVDAADEFVVNHENKLKVTIKSTALANRVVDVKMAELDAEGKTGDVIARTTLVLQPLPQGQVVELPYKPKTRGVKRLAIWVDPTGNERSLIDNRQEFQNLAVDPRIRVLYIEGQARFEYKYLHLALARDQNLELASALRITQDNRISTGGTVNGEPFSRLPVSLEDWKRFDVVIIGDVDSSQLTSAQQQSLEQFVRGGGALLMLGGHNSFGPGGYARTPIEQCLPVSVGDLKSPQEKTPFVPRLTPAGQTHPIMENLAPWFGSNPDDKHRLPPLRGNVVVGRPKTAASVLLIHPGRSGPDGQPQIVLAVQMYGSGRSAALTADTTWLWYLPLRGMGQESPYNRFWGQLVRWLAAQDVRNRSSGAGLDALLNKTVFQLGDDVKVRAMVRDERGDATSFAQVNIILKHPGQKDPRQLPLNPVRAGLYDVTIPAPDKGDWEAEIIATKDNKPLGRRTLKFTVIPPAEEMHRIAANPQLLKDIADRTGGFNFELAQLPKLIDHLIAAQHPDQKATEQVLSLANAPRALIAALWRNPTWDARYDLPMQALLVISLLITEWFLRRRWQLP